MLTTRQDVVVPGGQQVYVNPDGALAFTMAHSAYIPPGSLTSGFTYQPGAAYGDFSAPGGGFMACPVNGDWQVFVAVHNVTVPSGDVSSCLGFDALTSPYTGDAPVWQFI